MPTETPVAQPPNQTVAAARQALAAVPPDPGTCTDGQPGIITIAGIPMRPFGYFDFRLMKTLREDESLVKDPEAIVVILAYSMAQTTEAQLDALYGIHRDAALIRDKAERWTMGFSMAALAPISEYVAAQLDEYVDAEAGGGPDGELAGGLEGSAEGNSRPSQPESPPSAAPSLDSAG